MEQRRVCKKRTPNLAIGKRIARKILRAEPRTRLELPWRQIARLPSSPDGLVPQGSEVAEIAAGSTTQNQGSNPAGRLYRARKRRVVLAEIVLARCPSQKARASGS